MISMRDEAGNRFSVEIGASHRGPPRWFAPISLGGLGVHSETVIVLPIALRAGARSAAAASKAGVDCVLVPGTAFAVATFLHGINRSDRHCLGTIARPLDLHMGAHACAAHYSGVRGGSE